MFISSRRGKTLEMVRQSQPEQSRQRLGAIRPSNPKEAGAGQNKSEILRMPHKTQAKKANK